MVYADFKYYLNEYLGTLPPNSFNSLIIKASKEIDKNINTKLTQEKINNLQKEAQEQLKYTACALVDLIYKKEESENKKVTSFSIDGISKSFKVLSNDEYKSLLKEVIKCLPDEITCYL